MTGQNVDGAIHDLDVTLWVGKSGIEPAVDELSRQLEGHPIAAGDGSGRAGAGDDAMVSAD